MDKELSIIESLYPNFEEYANNATFFYWMDYACELDIVTNVAYADQPDGLAVIDYLNERMAKLASGKAEHHACTDVASTLEETIPSKFKGAFKYE